MAYVTLSQRPLQSDPNEKVTQITYAGASTSDRPVDGHSLGDSDTTWTDSILFSVRSVESEPGRWLHTCLYRAYRKASA